MLAVYILYRNKGTSGDLQMVMEPTIRFLKPRQKHFTEHMRGFDQSYDEQLSWKISVM